MLVASIRLINREHTSGHLSVHFFFTVASYYSGDGYAFGTCISDVGYHGNGI